MTFQQMLKTLWTRKLTIVVSVVVCVGAALAYSKVATPSYQSSALIQVNAPSQTGSTSSSTFTLPDPVQELGSTAVLHAAAGNLHDPNPSSIAGLVTGSVDPTTGALTITGTGSTAAGAEAVTQAYAQAFVDQIQVLADAQNAKYTLAINGVSARIAALQAQEVSSALPNATTANALLNAQISALSGTLSTLLTSQQTLLTDGPYAKIQVAATPGVSTGISKSKLGAIGLLAGLLVGCGIALVRDQFDDSLRISPDIESVIDSPLLGELPQDPDVKKGTVTIALVQAPQSPLAEAVRDLRTSLRVLLVGQQSPILVVTSPEPGDGKTFVTANLAAAWALTGSRVIVVSADFRRPRLEEAFGLDVADRPGLSDLIKANWKQAEPFDGLPDGVDPRETGNLEVAVNRRDTVESRQARRRSRSAFDETRVSAHLLETGIDGLQLLPVGVHLDNSSELFDSPGMQPVLDQLHLLADIILLDTPPVLSAPDTAILGGLTHGAIVVATESRTDRGDLERTDHRLTATGCQVIGLVLNHVRRTTSDNYLAYTYKR
ncbi:MAG TPA: Wzz/FepE/Etk N-terminal domain-containing protein [Acidimicrobiales bacterium]